MMLINEFFFGFLAGVDRGRGSLSFAPLFLEAAGRLKKSRFNCRLNDRVNFIDGLFESMLFIDDDLCILEEETG